MHGDHRLASQTTDEWDWSRGRSDVLGASFGSQADPQLSDICDLAWSETSRTLQNDIVTVRCQEIGYSGMTGIVGRLRYDKESGRLSPVTDFDGDDPSPDF